MARGFLSGALLGGAVSVGVAGVASVVAPLRDGPLPQDGAGQPAVQSDVVQEPATPATPVQTDDIAVDADTEGAAEDVAVAPDLEDTAVVEPTETPVENATPDEETVTAPVEAEPETGPAPEVSDAAPGAATAPQESAALAGSPLQSEDATVQTGSNAPQLATPDTDTLGTIQTTTVQTPNVPQPSMIAGLDAPAAGAASGQVALTQEDPVFPNPQALAPMLPQGADQVVIDTQPAAPRLPEMAQVDPVEAPEAPSQTDAPAQSEAPVQSDVEAQPPAQVTPVAPPVLSEAPQTTEPEAPAPQAPQEAEPPTENGQVAMIAPSARPQIGTPAISLTDRDGGVRIRRPGTDAQEPTEVTVITEEGATPTGDPRPIAQYAQPFSNPDNKPLMSIVLIDNGTSPTAGAAGIAALRSFPYPVNFAIDGNLADAQERMQLYREAGFEVMAMIDLPGGARATDVETTLGVTLSQLREVVGVLEGTAEGLQSSRAVSDQVAAILAQSGHGLVTQSKGLNTMPTLARREGVPADPVFRDFDSKGQSATVIRRFLDQAAFKAGQEGAVIMLGRLRPDTISALLLWGLQDRASSVAIAPISATLRREGG